MKPGREEDNRKLRDLITEAGGYFNGGALFAIEWAEEARDMLYVEETHARVVEALQAWLSNDEPRLPESLCRDTFAALRDALASRKEGAQ